MTKEIELLNRIPKEQIERVFKQYYCDISPEFIGFIDIYESLSKIIPKHFTVVDLGCAYNPQCFYFTEHKQYVAVDVSDCEKFQSENCVIYNKSIEKFITENLNDFNLKQTFAICSYVPPWGGDNVGMVKQSFENCFVYYPNGGYDLIIPKKP